MAMNSIDIFNELLNELRGKYPDDRIENIRELINHNEEGVALENICVDIPEFEIEISNIFFQKVEHLAKQMNISKRYLQLLSASITGKSP